MIAETIGKLLLALAAGFYLNKKNVITEEVNRSISYLVMNVALPMMILTSINNTQGTDRSALLKFILTGAVFYLLMPLAAKIIVWLMHPPKDLMPISEVFLVFANVIFMGYPVAASIYGNGCIFYLSIFHIMFNLMFFTYGTANIRKGSKAESEKFTIKSLLNIGTVASLVSLVLFFSGIQLPQASVNVLNFIGNISTPVSMISIGASIGMYSLKNLFADKRIFVVTALRLIVIPLAVYGIMTLLGFEGALRGIITISFGMPVASMVSMTSTQYKSHADLASSVVVFTTLCSLITMPFLLILMQRFSPM